MTDPAIPPPAIHVEDVTLTFGGATPVRALQDDEVTP